MIIKVNGLSVSSFTPRYGGQNIYIGIDSSKSDTAIAIANEYKEIIDDIEIIGAGSDIDVYQHCWEMRKALKVLFSGAKIIAIGIEDIITKKNGSYGGMEVHQSRAKITHVFDSLICFFQDNFEMTPKLINNQSWKAAVLPEEFRKKTHKKGSQDYFNSIGGRWAGRNDNVTDAVCILTYLMNLDTTKVKYPIKSLMIPDRKFSYNIFPISMYEDFPMKTKEFVYNDNFSFEHNLNSAVACLGLKDELGIFKTNVDNLTLDIIYSDVLCGVYEKDIGEVLVAFSYVKG